MQTSIKKLNLTASRIQLLDNQLANQIAAGEVVERPSSVVKELIENSIDAGATKIEVEIERGGARLIRVQDNGRGIHHDDLTLSLTRHATSKIHSSVDLACIKSLGFRGEALASISAVSKLTLTSRTYDSELAWQAMAHGRDMQVEVQPAAALPGTRIDVADLFFNTPARQKFLRAEKTEFNHIEEVFKRHALANFDLEFILKHNQKIIKRVAPCQNQSQYLNRIANICGKAFAENCISFQCQHESIEIYGWLGLASFHRSESDIQYVFINGRPVKDKTLNHAIKQAYDGLLPAGRMATYVIFLNMDPSEVDVNVHPTKHEVRFGEPRLVHDLLAKSVSDALADSQLSFESHQQQALSEGSFLANDSNNQNNANYSDSFQLINSEQAENTCQQIPSYQSINKEKKPYPEQISPSKYTVRESTLQTTSTMHSNSVGLLQTQPLKDDLWFLENDFVLVNLENKICLFNSDELFKEFLLSLLQANSTTQSKALLFPNQLTFDPQLLEEQLFHLQLKRLGFVYESVFNDSGISNQLSIKKIPIWMSCFDTQWIYQQLADWFKSEAHTNEMIINSVAQSVHPVSKELIRLIVDDLKEDLLMLKSVVILSNENIRKLL